MKQILTLIVFFTTSVHIHPNLL